jgi:urea carboxylase
VGTPVSAHYDPMLAKIIVTAATRKEAAAQLLAALLQTRVRFPRAALLGCCERLQRTRELTRRAGARQIAGLECNVAYLAQIVRSETFAEGRMHTRFLASFAYEPGTVDVLEPGTQTSVQDFPGRLGFWSVGVPPSGPMDALAFRTANRLAGNADSCAALEMTVAGATLRFNARCMVAVTGADMQPELDGAALPMYESVHVRKGQVLRFRQVRGPG